MVHFSANRATSTSKLVRLANKHRILTISRRYFVLAAVWSQPQLGGDDQGERRWGRVRMDTGEYLP